MFTRIAVVLAIALSFVACSMWSKPAKGWAGATGGENIERLFWDDVMNKDFTAVDAHLASSFTGSGPAGPMGRAAFLDHLRSAAITSVSLSECSTHLNGADLTIACIVQIQAATPRRLSTLSVWQEYKKGWLMVAHAETPVSH